MLIDPKSDTNDDQYEGSGAALQREIEELYGTPTQDEDT